MPLKDDAEHFKEVHQRWMTQRNRTQESSEYRDEWYQEQCFNCVYWISLSGLFEADYGACSNVASPFDKRVMFEHDGCDAFEPDRS